MKLLSVIVLLTTTWAAQTWGLVLSDTIKKCFRKVGINNCDFKLISRNVYPEDYPCSYLEVLKIVALLKSLPLLMMTYLCARTLPITTGRLTSQLRLDQRMRQNALMGNQEQEEEEEEEEGDSFCKSGNPKLKTLKEAMRVLMMLLLC